MVDDRVFHKSESLSPVLGPGVNLFRGDFFLERVSKGLLERQQSNNQSKERHDNELNGLYYIPTREDITILLFMGYCRMEIFYR